MTDKKNYTALWLGASLVMSLSTWTGVLAMALHVVKKNQSLSKIALLYRVPDWRSIYYLPQNEALRKRRPDPNRIWPGDVVYVPEAAPQATLAKVNVRSINILVHGVNTEAAWFKLIEQALAGMNMYAIIPFTWGDYTTRKQGGNPVYAADEVTQLFENPFIGYDRLYQGHSAIRLKKLIDACRKLSVRVNVIAHSNGTLLTAGALLLGAQLENFILMGSPLDCDNDRSQSELAKAITHVSGRVINFWSPQDEWAHVKGGIGAYGDNSTYIEKNKRVENVKFVAGSSIKGVRIVATGKDYIDQGKYKPPKVVPNFGHSDYMLKEHMGIFASYIKELATTGSAARTFGEVGTRQLNELREMGDWTRVSFYKSKKNVTLESPEMKDYKVQIDEILK